MLKEFKSQPTLEVREPIVEPQNKAYTSLNLRFNSPLGLESELTELADLPEQTVFLEQLPASHT